MSSSWSLPHHPQLDDVDPEAGRRRRRPSAGLDGDDVELGLAAAPVAQYRTPVTGRAAEEPLGVAEARPPARSRCPGVRIVVDTTVPSSWIVIGSSTISSSGARCTPSAVTLVTISRSVRLRVTSPGYGTRPRRAPGQLGSRCRNSDGSITSSSSTHRTVAGRQQVDPCVGRRRQRGDDQLGDGELVPATVSSASVRSLANMPTPPIRRSTPGSAPCGTHG